MKLSWQETQENTAVPSEGWHTGNIENVEIVERDFNDGEGPQERVQISFSSEIEPDALHLTRLFTPILHEKSYLGRLVDALGQRPGEGEEFDLQSLKGAKVRFRVKKKSNGFSEVVGDNITPA